DFEGKEVLSQLCYGFRVSFSFAVLVAVIGYSIGITVGAIMGYFGGWVDIIVQRIIEVWSSIPFLYTMMIIASITHPQFIIMVVMLVLLRSWLGITYTIRGEFYREKARDYVQAARALGVRRGKIMARHIFPNALVPVVTFMPFGIVSYIFVLVALDFLGFGLPPGTPSWGRLLRVGSENISNYPELVYAPILAVAATLFCVVMVGEAVREAFDPKLYSRLR
ncbi:MAG: ABC transporter permease subunit, partial [Planctomycetota bacterium]